MVPWGTTRHPEDPPDPQSHFPLLAAHDRPGCPRLIKDTKVELSSGPMVRTVLSLPRAHVRSLVRELRSYKLINHCGQKNRDSQVILAARLLHLEITPPDRSALAL